jgi:hypothetical protein
MEERHGHPWSEEEEKKLYDAFSRGNSIPACSFDHQRNEGAITTRLRRMGLIDDEGNKIDPIPEFKSYGLKRRARRKEKKLEAANQPKPVDRQKSILEKFVPTKKREHVADRGRILKARSTKPSHQHLLLILKKIPPGLSKILAPCFKDLSKPQRTQTVTPPSSWSV